MVGDGLNSNQPLVPKGWRGASRKSGVGGWVMGDFILGDGGGVTSRLLPVI